MSYSCEINFKHIEAEDIPEFFLKLKKHAVENLENIANDEYCFYKETMYKTIENWARLAIFNYRWFYDKENKLLGVFSIQNCMKNLFDSTIYFQNSCDQDYDYSDWNGIELFENIANKWKNATIDDVVKALDYELCENNFDEFDTSEEGVEYNKRSLCYDEIWKMFSDYLYDEDSVTYISLFGWYDAEPLMKFEYYIKEKRKKEGFM